MAATKGDTMSARSIAYLLVLATWHHEELEVPDHRHHRLTAGDLSIEMTDEQFRDLISVVRAAEAACYDSPPYDDEALPPGLHFPRPQVPGRGGDAS